MQASKAGRCDRQVGIIDLEALDVGERVVTQLHHEPFAGPFRFV